VGKVNISFAASAVTDLDEIAIWYADQGVRDVGRGLSGGFFGESRRLKLILNWHELFPSLSKLIYGN
jgi:hypothetical protein